MRRGPRTAGFVLTAAVMLLASRAALAQGPGAAAVATTPQFVFYSDFTTNLNDALIAAGVARRASKAELFQSGPEQTCFEGLPVAERSAWNRAVDYYAEIVSPAQHTAPVQLLPRLELAGVIKKDALTNASEQRYLDIMSGFRAAAAPAYERCRWAAQDAGNRRWIAGVIPLLARYERPLAQRLPELFGTPWAGLPFRVDVVETVSFFASADSVNTRPPGLHILVSSSNVANQDLGALEVVFHEACHFLTGFNTPFRAAFGASARDLGGIVRGDVVHATHFFMTGEAVRRILEKPGDPAYTPILYAQSLFSTEFRDAIAKVWPAYMDGKRTLQEAAADLIRALGK